MSFAAGFAFYEGLDETQLKGLSNTAERWLDFAQPPSKTVERGAGGTLHPVLGGAALDIEPQPETQPTQLPVAAPEPAHAAEIDGEDAPSEGEENAASRKPEPTPETDEAGSDLERELPSDVMARMTRANLMMNSNQRARERALEIYRTLGQKYQTSEVLGGWSRAAGRAKWWGESLRIALRWAAVDPGADAQLHLARTQRLVGQRFGAIQTLERLLERVPSHQEATAMLQRYRER